MSFSLGLLNARSVANKTEAVHEFIIDNSIAIMALTETWLKLGDDPLIKDLCPSGHYFIGVPRPPSKGKCGGGVGFVIDPNITAERLPEEIHRTFESVVIKVKANQPLHLALIYRPPPSQKNGLTTVMFLDEIEEYVTSLCSNIPGNFVLLGDFNLHWNDENDHAVKRFRDMLTTLDLMQLVSTPTHISGHVLDLVITRDCMRNRLNLCEVKKADISDHSAVICNVEIKPSTRVQRKISCRALKRIDADAFASDLRRAIIPLDAVTDPEALASSFHEASGAVTDKHAPLRTITVKGDGLKPWYDDDIHQARVERRRLERKYRKTKLTVHWEMFQTQAKHVTDLLKKKKSDYFNGKFASADAKTTFKLVNELLHNKTQQSYPSDIPENDLAQSFSDFFVSRIQKIRSGLDALHEDLPLPEAEQPSLPAHLSSFSPQSQEDIRSIIKTCTLKNCLLDSVPAALLKNEVILNTLVPILTAIINQSITSGIVPTCFKQALVTPILKKPNADVNDLKNYRPISNITFPAKLLEKVVARQLVNHMTANSLHDPLQSAYKRGASAETALLYIKSDIDRLLDNGDAVLMVFLDLSAAFDTLDHERLLKRLEEHVGLTGTVIDWMRSYLADRKQTVRINNRLSQSSDLSVGVPQGSVLGPLLFLCYMLPLKHVVQKHGILRHAYADDTQLYCPLSVKNPSEMNGQIRKMEQCLEEVKHWMNENKLKMNDAKTEVLVIARKIDHDRVKNIRLQIGDATITPQNTVRNLGALFDHRQSMNEQINSVTKSAYYHLRRISKIRHCLTHESCARAIHATVTSRLDLQNGLLLGQPRVRLRKLQIAQNNAARLLSQISKRDHITPVLAQLHWLPIEERIHYKVLCIIQQSFHVANAPSYLREMCKPFESNRPLRSSDDAFKLHIPRVYSSYGSRSVQYSGAILWNSLPLHLRSPQLPLTFKKKLKTFMFSAYFN